MSRPARPLLRDVSGATAIELALVLPVFLVLVFGVFEFARLMWTREALAQTAAAGARCMAMSASGCQSSGAYSSASTTTYIDGVAANWGVTLTGTNLSLNNAATCSGVTAPKGFSTVTISYTFSTVVPNEVVSLAGGESLSATACYPNE